MGLGTLLEKIINVVTFGYGKRMATWVAKKLGKDDWWIVTGKRVITYT